jgi:hypothetical protein
MTQTGNRPIRYSYKRLTASEQVENMRSERLFNALWVIETYYSKK